LGEQRKRRQAGRRLKQEARLQFRRLLAGGGKRRRKFYARGDACVGVRESER
jgi:hypothetical protein